MDDLDLEGLTPSELEAVSHLLERQLLALDEEDARARKRIVGEARDTIRPTRDLLELFDFPQVAGHLSRADQLLRFEQSRINPRPAPPPAPEPASASEVNWFNGPSFVGNGAADRIGQAVTRAIRAGGRK